MTVPLGDAPHDRPVPGSRPPLDAVSVVSLVTAVLGVTIVGLVTGIVGVARTAGGKRRGRGLAIAGIAVSVLVAVVQVLVVVAAWPAFEESFREGSEQSRAAGTAGADEPDAAVSTAPATADPATEPDTTVGTAPATEPSVATSTAAEAGELVPFDELTVGDCFDDPTGEEFSDIVVLPCDVPHDGEFIATITLDDSEWPGDDAVFDASFDACLVAVADAFEAVGVERQDLDFWTFTPTREGWVLYDDREAACLAYGLDGPLTTPVLPQD